MIYMLQVYLLVALPIFALAGALTLGLYAYAKVQEYARARRAMRRIILAASRRLAAISTIDRLDDSHLTPA